tara:strand:+ start:242 stop:451 length:210 start_codon:yes stop_codon:yes gene_type:complete
MKYTVEWHDKMERWDVVRWDTTAEGVYAGTTVDRCSVLEEAQEICDYHTDMMNPELWADVERKFDREMA